MPGALGHGGLTVTAKYASMYVTDPLPAPPKGLCEFKILPNADEVILCKNQAVAAISAPCCGQETLICQECLGKGGLLGSWRCDGCGSVTDCKRTPMRFGLRYLA